MIHRLTNMDEPASPAGKGSLAWLVATALFLVVGLSCTSSATPTATSERGRNPASAPQTLATGTVTTTQTPWVRDRVRAIEGLYSFSPAGREWLESYDLRQMVGQPGWFGSHGYDGWAGVGQAIPVTILHELSHSYYGAFPVTGRPDLSWETPPGAELSPALNQYNEDLKTFMAQPPDSYEPLRDRFRNLPNLSLAEGPDLFHFGEAELIYMVGGNLELIPPILRKYFDQFLQPGEFQTWVESIGWYLGLREDDKRVADGFFGLTHFPLINYEGLRPGGAARLAPEIRAIMEEEERQRLKDFASQYDLIKETEFGEGDPASFEASFKFWRGLLHDMLELHRKHPRTLAQEGGSRGQQIAAALDTFLEAERLNQQEQVLLFRQARGDPLMRDFTVLLKSRVLVDLMEQTSAPADEEPVDTVIRRFAEKLKAFITEVERIATIGGQDPSRGARELEGFLAGLSDEGQKENLDLILSLLRETDESTAEVLLDTIDDASLLRMVENNPGAAKNGHVQPQRLFAALNLTSQSSRARIAEGIQWLLKNTAGNFQIDAPFTDLAHQAIAEVAARRPREALAILHETRLPLIAQPFAPFITDYPHAVRDILASDLSVAASLVANREGYAETPHGILHALIVHDPVLAGQLVVTLDRIGRDGIVTNSLIVFAFDARRLATYPGVNLSLEGDKEFLEYLIVAKGERWVLEAMRLAVQRYDVLVRARSIDEEYLHAYAETLSQILAAEKDPAIQRTMSNIFEGAFRDVGTERFFNRE